ncbi:immunoglobulin domain-containing protein [Winogradskyella sp.]|uniref:immunoglobulin domain-containing protein n=1 Tax=Winogradskyella sp. TaxID=1883156 RepID=UPI003AA9D43F
MKRLLLFTLILFGVCVNAQEISQSDKDALIALYNATDGANWTNKWDLTDSPENWYGVVTSVVFGASGAERHVDEINLSNNNLRGSIPVDLGNLKGLNTLNLSNNNLTSVIPGALGNAKDLNYLYLQNNQLTGNIPVELFTLNERHFVEINLSHNKLTGKLPVEIGESIANVGEVFVSNNLLTDLPDYTNVSLFRINTLDISNNNINFSVFERVPSFDNIAKVLEDNVATLTYSPQNRVGEIETIELNVGENISFSITGLTSANNTYQWYKNDVPIGGATNSTCQITGSTLTDAGVYYCEIQNPNVPNLTLKRNIINYNTIGAINDRNALISLYDATDGANWTDSWGLNEAMSTWKGVTLNTDGRVISLSLDNRKLNGELPNELGNLTELIKLHLNEGSSSSVRGSIPDSICNLVKIEDVIIDMPGLTGAVPSCLFTIASLRSVYLDGNSPLLTLDFPDDLSNLTNLTTLSLSRIDLSSNGGFPMSILDLTNLEKLSLYITRLTGSIPEQIGLLSNLTELSLRHSGALTGVIPSSIGDLTKLNSLTIVSTDIEGEIPSSFSKLTSLRALDLSRNKLTGHIPSYINTFNTLTSLDFSHNNLSGTIPDFTTLTNLQNLEFDNNKFVFKDFENEYTNYKNQIPYIFSYQPQLKIDEEQNITVIEEESITLIAEATNSTNNSYQWRKDGVEINGATNRSYTINSLVFNDNGVYDCVIKNSIITDLILLKNEVTLKVKSKGAIHDKNALIAFYNATDGANWTNPWDLNADISTWEGVTVNTVGRVTELDIRYRKLNGTLPDDLGNLTELRKLTLLGLGSTSNGLTGSIPSSLCNLTKIEEINIDQLNLTGVIPGCLFNIISLKNVKIDGHGNMLTLDFPDDLSELINLTSLYLSNVDLSSEGDFPENILDLTNLERLILFNNELTGSIPTTISNLTKLKELSIRAYKMSGSIPDEIGALVNLESLSFNIPLTGLMPASIGDLIKLKSLRIYGNIEGEIPASFSKLTALYSLDFSRNKLTGQIPQFINTFSNLQSLELGGNKLSGVIPDLTSLTKLQILDIQDNQFVFEDFENEFNTYKTLFGFFYQPQSNIDTEEIITVIEENEVRLTIEATKSTNNTYQWRKDGVDINGATSREYVIESVKLTDKGVYDCVISNSLITDLKLTKNRIILNVDPSDLDGDGIKDVDDLCLNTPAGESVNSNGCSESQLDDDNDGINNDKDLCPNTPTGEPVNVDGCSESQLDDDNDGVFNNFDKCPNTSEGSVVDANGCAQYQLIDIVPRDIQVMVSSTTCPDKSNGIVNLSFKKDYTYKVILVGQGVINKTFDNVNYTSGLEITGLPVGSYEICVTASELPSFSQCYNVLVSAPAALKVSQTSLKGTSLTYQVSGSENYKVTVNNKEYLYTFKDAGEREITVNLNNGNNSVEITTNKPCQGVYNKSVTVKSVTLYPIPVANYLNISGITDNTAMVTVRSLEGATVLSAKLDVNNGVARLPMDTLATGMYLVTVTTSTQTVNTKIFKK